MGLLVAVSQWLVEDGFVDLEFHVCCSVAVLVRILLEFERVSRVIPIVKLSFYSSRYIFIYLTG